MDFEDIFMVSKGILGLIWSNVTSFYPNQSQKYTGQKEGTLHFSAGHILACSHKIRSFQQIIQPCKITENLLGENKKNTFTVCFTVKK